MLSADLEVPTLLSLLSLSFTVPLLVAIEVGDLSTAALATAGETLEGLSMEC